MTLRKYQFIRDYLDMIEHGHFRNEPLTDAPTQFHLATIVSVMGTILGRSTFFRIGGKRIYPNLWTVLVAKSSVFRKSTSISLGLDLLRQISSDKILPSEFSLEKLIQVLEKTPEGIFHIDEFCHFFSQFYRSYMSGGIGFFLQLYETDTIIRRELISGSYLLENPCISILSGTTFEGISSSLKESEIRTGLLPRFCFVAVTRKDREVLLPDSISYSKKSQLVSLLNNIRTRWETPTSFEITDEARRAYEKDVVSLQSDTSDLVPFMTRLSIVWLKIAIILAASEGRSKIETKDIVASGELVKVFQSSIAYTYSYITWTPFQEKRRKVLDILTATTDWVPRTELLRKTRMSSSELNSVITTLMDEDLIEVERRRWADEKKPTNVYRFKG